MFYCNDCAKKNKWPYIGCRSYGRCEVCEKTGPCMETASSNLPTPPVEKETPVPDNKLTPAQALRWLDRNAALLTAGTDPVTKEQFDDALTVLWEVVLNGK